MNNNQNFVYLASGTTNYMFFYPPEGIRPFEPSVTVFENIDGEFSPQPSISSTPVVNANPNTTVSAPSGDGIGDPRVVHVSSATGIDVGQFYVVRQQRGFDWEWVEVVSVSGTAVTCRRPLRHSYSSGDTFREVMMQAQILSSLHSETSINDSHSPTPRWRVRWTYTTAGEGTERFIHDSYMNFVRYSVETHVTPLDVDQAMPGWLESLPIDDRFDQGKRLIADAHRAVTMDLYGRGLAMHAIRDTEAVNELTVARCLMQTERSKQLAGGGREFGAPIMQKFYDDRLLSLVAGKVAVPVDTTGDGAARSISPRPIFVR